jgi:hypothetical protein
VDGPMNDSSPGVNPGHHLESATVPDDQPIVTDWSVRMRERRRRAARLAEATMPLARYYRHHGGPLLAEPIGAFYVVGRWAS